MKDLEPRPHEVPAAPCRREHAALVVGVWLADLLGLDGVGPEVGLNWRCLAGDARRRRAGQTRGARLGPGRSLARTHACPRCTRGPLAPGALRCFPLQFPLAAALAHPRAPTTASHVHARGSLQQYLGYAHEDGTGPLQGAGGCGGGDEVEVEFPIRPLPWKEGSGHLKGKPSWRCWHG